MAMGGRATSGARNTAAIHWAGVALALALGVVGCGLALRDRSGGGELLALAAVLFLGAAAWDLLRRPRRVVVGSLLLGGAAVAALLSYAACWVAGLGGARCLFNLWG